MPDITADVLDAQVWCRVHGWFAWWRGHRKWTAAGNLRVQCAPCQRAERTRRYARQKEAA